MNIKLRYCIVWFCMYFAVFRGFAQQPILAGGEVYYELIGPLKYKVTAQVYRKCEYPALKSLQAYVFAGPYQIPMSFTRVGISKINDSCGNPCNNQNDYSNAGFEKHTFMDTVDFNFSPYDVVVSNNTCLVHFAILMNARPYNITTFNAATNFYLDASTDICLSGIKVNHSPVFSMEPKFYAYYKAPFCYSPGPIDTTDNDSFAFSLVAPQSHVNTYLSYYGSYTSQIPLKPYCASSGSFNCTPEPTAQPPKGFYFDPLTCTTIFTPYNAADVGTIRFRIDEYRFNKIKQKYEWLGNVTREMVLMLVSATGINNPVSISSNRELNLCEGDSVCTSVVTADAKATYQSQADSTTLFWDHGIKDGTLGIRNKAAREKSAGFCWQTRTIKSKREANYFTVAAYDRQCNLNLVSRTTAVNVHQQHPYTYSNKMGNCGWIGWNVSVSDSLYPDYRGVCFTNIRSLSSGKLLFSGYGLKDSTVIGEDGKIVVEHMLDTFCPAWVRDTLTVTGSLQKQDINTKDSIVCRGLPVSFGFSPSHLNGLQSFEWLLNDSVVNTSDTIVQIKFQKNSGVRLKIENNWGCKEESVLQIAIKERSNVLKTGNDTLCPGVIWTLMPDIASLQRPLTYRWNLNGKDTSASDSILYLKLNENTKVRLTVKDAGQCGFSDSAIGSVWPQVHYTFKGPAAVCTDSVLVLKAVDFFGTQPFIYQWKVNKVDQLHNDSTLNVRLSTDADVELKIIDMHSCEYADTLGIVAMNTPVVKLPQDMTVCYGSLTEIQPVVANKPSYVRYNWLSGNIRLDSGATLKRKFMNSETIRLRVANELNCATEVAMNINLFPYLPLSVNHNSDYRPDETVFLSCTKTYQTYLWFNNSKDPAIAFKASDLGAPGKYSLWCRTTDVNGCNYSDTFDIRTDLNLGLYHTGWKDMKIYPNPVADMLQIEITADIAFELFASDGRLLTTYSLKAGINQLDLSCYTSGVYFLKAGKPGNIYKLIKE